MAEDNKNEIVEEVVEKNEIAVQGNATALSYTDTGAMQKLYKMAATMAKSDFLPDAYKGRPENVMLAMDMASRMGMGFMTVCQNLYIVKGKPSWSGQFCVAAIKGCGRYDDVEFVWVGDEGTENFGCYMQAREIKTGKIVKGSVVDWKMVKAEGWLSKNGSKWATMPEQMFKYRAAAFFARTECPEVLMGLQTVDEVKDVHGYEDDKKKTVVINLNDLSEVEVVE